MYLSLALVMLPPNFGTFAQARQLKPLLVMNRTLMLSSQYLSLAVLSPIS